MDIARSRYLVSSAGRAALSALDTGLGRLDSVALATHLRREFAPPEASALAEQLSLRVKAEARGAARPGFLYSAPGLEMMTHPLVSARRAARLAALGLSVVDLTAGLGGDLASVAAEGVRAAGLERDLPTALLARANVPAAEVVRGDAVSPPFELDGVAVVLDPSRREGGTRRFDPAAFSPPFDTCVQLALAARAAVMKAPPGIEHHHIPPEAEAEFVEVGRSLREAALWFGVDARPGLRRAVFMRYDTVHELTSDAPEVDAGAAPIGQFVYDPASCVTRAGLVRHLGARLGGAQLLDPQLAYLTSISPAHDPLADTFEVLDVLPFSVSRLRERLRSGPWRPDEIRRRAFPIEPDELRRLLGRFAGEPVTLLCTTIAGRKTIIIAKAHPTT